MDHRRQPANLFAEPPQVAEPPPTALYADVVFDRPLNQAYTYAVPPSLADRIAIGKRVEVQFGRGDRSTFGYCVHVHDSAPDREVKPILGIPDAEPLLNETLLRLTRWMADYYLCGWGQVLQAVLPAGVRDSAGLKSVRFVTTLAPPPDAEPLTAKQQAALDKLHELGGDLEVGQLLRAAKVGPGVIAAIVEKGYGVYSTRAVERDRPDPTTPAFPPVELNAGQLAALEPIFAAIDAGGFRPFLLHGVTGSGKTEIYLRAIERVVAAGRQALVLVPEISLTPQTIERFRGRCGTVAVLHSHLGDAERGGHWRKVAAGQVAVVVGARSAVFAPTPNLGLIVVDEEHEPSYKQESTPRYHGRDVAVMRARMEGVPVLLGSATPSLESWHNARRGQYTLVSLPARVAARPLPPVGIIDLRREFAAKGPRSSISPTLERAMHQALKAGGQVMLLLNRRGFSTHIHCPGCGYVAGCQNCDLALTFHRQRNGLICHYCGYESPPIAVCPQCQAAAIRYQGVGTEKLQAEVTERFAGAVVQRMDSDTMQRPGSHARVLEAFRDGRVHVLLGTQMIAKGFDFPSVTLVGVINADVGLHLPDFRAAERTFQLLAQVAGRTGRGERGGRVLVQTFTPEHPCITLAAKHDYEAFAAHESAIRQAHEYPPFSRLARVILRGPDAAEVGEFADRLAAAFRLALPKTPGVRLLGPAECPVFRLNNLHRFHFQLQSADPKSLHQLLRYGTASVRPPGKVEVQIDIDPYSMM